MVDVMEIASNIGMLNGVEPDLRKGRRGSQDKLKKDFHYFSNPNHSFGYLSRSLFRSFLREIERKSLLLGVSAGQWTFLSQLWIEDRITQRELSDRVGRSEPTTVIAVNGLVRAGLVRRVPCTIDRRKIYIYLTQRARELQSQVLAIEAVVDARANLGISPAELATFHKVISQINTNLAGDWRDGPASYDDE
jgi:MarR family transcriptional regulator, transcriptional regulator for hemolysin